MFDIRPESNLIVSRKRKFFTKFIRTIVTLSVAQSLAWPDVNWMINQSINQNL